MIIAYIAKYEDFIRVIICKLTSRQTSRRKQVYRLSPIQINTREHT